MNELFRGQVVWEIVENGYVEPSDQEAYNSLTQVEKDSLKDQRKKDRKMMFYIHQAMHERILPRVASAKKDKETWDTLQTSYQGMEKVKTSKLQILRRYFETLSMKDTNSIDSFYTHVIGFINQIKSHGETIEDRKFVEKVLMSIPPKFDTLVVTLEENKDLSQFSLDEPQASLINNEHRLNRSSMSLEKSFFSQSSISRGRGRGRYKSRGRGRSSIKGGRSNSPANTGGRGKNPNTSQPSNQRFSSITLKSMDIMHISVGRDNTIRTIKVKISQTSQILPLVLFLWCALKQCL
jgi:hypothetical protein